MAQRSIQPDFILRVCLLVVSVCVVFVLMTFFFLFFVEDAFLERNLERERIGLEQHFDSYGEWRQPETAGMRVYLPTELLPDGIGNILAQEPNRVEFYGDQGRHYHIARLADTSVLVYEVSDQLLVRPLRTGLLVTFGLLGLIATAVAGYIAFGLARKTIKPLADLSDHIAGLQPNVPPEDFAHAYPDNEIGHLAMQLEQSLHRIQAFIDRETRFARDISHDLRTPLAVSATTLELLAKPDVSAEKRLELVSRMAAANSHMTLTVSALLSMSRESGRQEANRRHLLPVIENTILQYGHLLEDKPVDIDVAVDRTAQVLLADGVLEILLSNLLSNAFQYTVQGTITVSFARGVLSICDTGEGIPESLQGIVMEPTIRSDHSSGYGLGLSIVKRLCEHHDIGVDVQTSGSGTVVSLSF